MAGVVQHAYPIMLDLADRLVVVVGAGAVAVRKVDGLVAGGANRLRVVAPVFHEKLYPDVQRIQQPYQSQYINGAFLVFAATDSAQVNDAVVRDASELGILVQRVDGDEEDPGDFATPAVLRDGLLTITVSTTGSPGLSGFIRDQLKQRLDPRWAEMARAMHVLRPKIRNAAQLSPQRRRAVLTELATPQAMDVLSAGGIAKLHEWIGSRYPELANNT
jgi:precorrin-2 dehydrogenase/sirohydrochlorin ferrochelatase